MGSNHYHTLGLSEDAGDDEIRQRYRELAKVLHPDRNRRPTAEQEFKELQDAYTILSDISLRREHNAELALARVSDEPADEVDNVMTSYGIAPYKEPKKKKIKKKKKKVVMKYHPPAEANYEDIPDGYEPRDFLEEIK